MARYPDARSYPDGPRPAFGMAVWRYADGSTAVVPAVIHDDDEYPGFWEDAAMPSSWELRHRMLIDALAEVKREANVPESPEGSAGLISWEQSKALLDEWRKAPTLNCWPESAPSWRARRRSHEAHRGPVLPARARLPNLGRRDDCLEGPDFKRRDLRPRLEGEPLLPASRGHRFSYMRPLGAASGCG